jgi:hypothetical protein
MSSELPNWDQLSQEFGFNEPVLNMYTPCRPRNVSMPPSPNMAVQEVILPKGPSSFTGRPLRMFGQLGYLWGQGVSPSRCRSESSSRSVYTSFGQCSRGIPVSSIRVSEIPA